MLFRLLRALVTAFVTLFVGSVVAQSSVIANDGTQPNAKSAAASASVAPSSTSSAGAPSQVGAGDTLVITVYGHSELSSRVTVDVDGRITLPFIGELQVEGQSPSSVGRAVARALREGGYLIDPQVAVDVVTVRSQVASILGEVRHPGRYAIEGRLTLLELIALAGGLEDKAGSSVTVLRRTVEGNTTSLHIPLTEGVSKQPTNEARALELQAGDVVHVGEAPLFYVYGEVLRAGEFSFEQDMNVMRALSLAGGLTQRGSERRLEIRRVHPETGKLVRIRVTQADPVLPGDVVFVNERFF